MLVPEVERNVSHIVCFREFTLTIIGDLPVITGSFVKTHTNSVSFGENPHY